MATEQSLKNFQKKNITAMTRSMLNSTTNQADTNALTYVENTVNLQTSEYLLNKSMEKCLKQTATREIKKTLSEKANAAKTLLDLSNLLKIKTNKLQVSFSLQLKNLNLLYFRKN